MKSELSIEYRAEDQIYLPEDWPSAEDYDFWLWGVHTLKIESGKNCGTSTWQPAQPAQAKREAGPGWRLERISDGKKKKRKTAKQTRREQQGRFRDQLLEMDGCCAVTGEPCETSLEAAHIVDDHEGGRAKPENGMLLRADIHRLFDARRFQICPETGKVLVDADFDYTSFTLQDASISEGVLKRIRTALQERGRLPAQ